MAELRILFLGDIFASPGRAAVRDYLGFLRKNLRVDVVIANVENAAHGFGITAKIYQELSGCGIDVMTGGNHIWDNIDVMSFVNQTDRLVRPLNMPQGTPGQGMVDITVNRKKIRVINLLGKLFMEPMTDVWQSIKDAVPPGAPADAGLSAVIVDFHAEASSEKLSLAYALDGRVSALIGTHTHVPTADTRILPQGTAYQTDAGMCGVYDSVIGVDKQVAIDRFKLRVPRPKLKPAQGEGMVSGVLVTVDTNGLAKTVAPVRYGPGLTSHLPEI